VPDHEIGPACQARHLAKLRGGLLQLGQLRIDEFAERVLGDLYPFVESKFLDEGDGFVYAGEQAIAGVKGPTLRVGLAGVDDVLDGVLVERVFLIEIAGHALRECPWAYEKQTNDHRGEEERSSDPAPSRRHERNAATGVPTSHLPPGSHLYCSYDAMRTSPQIEV
jgi:hypothetical protein